jgi:flagella basal body P-ring formation protein FlgA
MKKIMRLAMTAMMALSTILPGSAAETPLKQVIAETIASRVPAPGRYEITLPVADDAIARGLHEGSGRRLERLNYNPATQSFSASFVYRNDLGNEERATLSGTAIAVISVPTLLQDVATGEAISASSLSTIEVPAMRASSTMITASDMIIGHVARRPVRAGTALFASDFSKPVMVKKGDTVTILAEMPGIRISAQGKAMSNGGKGDVISFMNTSSRRSIDARIIDAGTAVITSPTRTASTD